MSNIKLTSRNNAEAEWNDYLPGGKTVWKVGGKLYTSKTRHVSYFGGLDLTPITQGELNYLTSRGIKL